MVACTLCNELADNSHPGLILETKHWRVIPRYDRDVTVADITFNDPEFAHHYNKSRQDTVPPEVARAIVTEIKLYV